jgi:hypothetical protein
MAFADSFAVAYHFRLLYLSSQCVYPVMGALRKVYDYDKWQVNRRLLTNLPHTKPHLRNLVMGHFIEAPS